MKIKTDFVTNSSSTSFVLSVPMNTKLKAFVKIDLEDYVSYNIRTLEGLYEYSKNMGYSNNDYIIAKAHDEIVKGNEIKIMEVSTEGDSTSRYLCENGLNDVNFEVDTDVKIIMGEGGY